jgi:broad specificity phosphatase PhoE
MIVDRIPLHRAGIVAAIATLWLLALALPALCQQSGPPTVVIVIRHAEKGPQGSDPALSAAGVARTQALIEALAGADVSAVYATQYRRTRETVQPLAERLGIGVTELEITSTNTTKYPTLIAADILARHKGKSVVVAGHSNTVPAIVEALGLRPVPAMTETQFDRMYIVVIPAEGEPRVLSTRYGVPTE